MGVLLASRGAQWCPPGTLLDGSWDQAGFHRDHHRTDAARTRKTKPYGLQTASALRTQKCRPLVSYTVQHLKHKHTHIYLKLTYPKVHNETMLQPLIYTDETLSIPSLPITVPASSGLFTDHSQASTEHLAGVEIFKQKDYVFRLSTMKRFTDATQIAILTKMRQSGGCKLTTAEWKALRDTDISTLSATEQQQRLQGTSLWYQSAPTWATVSMAQVIRSRLSALEHKATLYFIPAKTYLLNRPFNPRLR